MVRIDIFGLLIKSASPILCRVSSIVSSGIVPGIQVTAGRLNVNMKQFWIFEVLLHLLLHHILLILTESCDFDFVRMQQSPKALLCSEPFS